MRHLDEYSAPKKPMTAFPTFDGEDTYVAMFLVKLVGYKADAFFDEVEDWSEMTDATAKMATQLVHFK